ncbi:MAG: hypothetical protein QOD77_300 [Thermoplasmata archaeon]|jgi:hypothetical protein|nr:hypothetical protein [Thermoplasmata archaeon]
MGPAAMTERPAPMAPPRKPREPRTEYDGGFGDDDEAQ